MNNFTVLQGKKEEKDKILSSIRSILSANNLFTLSTIDEKNTPHSSTAFFVFDDKLNFYFWTDPRAQHSKNISENSRVAVNIFDSRQEWGSLLKGVQVRGAARSVTKKELLIGGALYIKRFPNVVMYVKKVLDFHSKKFQSRLYTIEPNWIKLFDEAAFGKEEWRVVEKK